MACLHNSVGVKQERNERNDKEKEKNNNSQRISNFAFYCMRYECMHSREGVKQEIKSQRISNLQFNAHHMYTCRTVEGLNKK